MSSNRSWLKVVKRLSQMDRDELGVRARQEVAKRSDLVRSKIGARFIEYRTGSFPVDCGHFFFEPADVPRILDFLRRRLPHVVDEIICQAEQICRHRFDLLGYQGLNYGAQIDWHLDAVHGKSAPQRAWYKIPYLDFDQVGDAKITWELNRHQHLVTLAKAYRLTGRPHFAQEIFEQWYDWQQQNPYPIGINWASSLEVAFRSLSWLWIWHLLQGSAETPKAFSVDLWQALMLHARHIERFLSTYFSPNTHLLGEAVGLFCIGTLCAGSRSAQRWRRSGWQLVLSEAVRQVRPDGMHFEQSFYYHVYALDFFLHARILAELNRIPIPGTFNRTIEIMLNALCSLHKAGSVSGLGDDDGGRVFDGRRNRSQHLIDPLATGAVLFDRADFKAVAGDIREETAWLLGIEGAHRFEGILPQPAPATSLAFRPSGIFVMSNSKPLPQQLVINTCPEAVGRVGHRHADSMSVQLSVNGQLVLIDPGTFGYAESGERDRFRGTGSHNTIQIDGTSQAEPDGPFAWRGMPNASLHRWVSSNSFDFFSGSHDGYSRLHGGVRHTRSVFFLKPYFWFIRDLIKGDGDHHLDLSWHFAPGTLSTIPGGATFLGDNQATVVLLLTASRECMQRLSQGWYSPVYGNKEPSPLLRFSTRACLPFEFATLLMPVSQAHTNTGLLQPLTAKRTGASLQAYQYSEAGSVDYFFFSDESGSWQCGPWVSDARFLFGSISFGKLIRFVICDGSYLELGGRQIFFAKAPLVRDEWLVDATGPELPSDHAAAMPKQSLLNRGTDGNCSAMARMKLSVQ